MLFFKLPVTQLHFDTILYVLPQASAKLVPGCIAIVMSLKKVALVGSWIRVVSLSVSWHHVAICFQICDHYGNIILS